MRAMWAAAMLLLGARPLLAAAPETARTDPGKPVRVGYYSVFHPDCSAGAAPDIRVTAAPKAGTIVITGGTLTTKRIASCPKVSAPVRQIIYRPRDGFTGTDEVTFDVVDPAGGKPVSHTVTITVGTPPIKI